MTPDNHLAVESREPQLKATLTMTDPSRCGVVETIYEWLGFQIAVYWYDRALKESVDRVLSYHRIHVAQSQKYNPWDLSLNVRRSRGVAALSPDLTLVARHETGVDIYKKGKELLIEKGDGRVRISPDAGLIDAELPFRKPAFMDADQYLLLTFSLLMFVRYRAFYALHGAALTNPTGEGVLFAAGSDSGKSTMAMSLVQQGWHYLSDDSVFLTSTATGIEARPFRYDFGLDPEAVRLFPEIGEARSLHFADFDKWRIDMGSLYPEQRAEKCTPTLLVFPRLSGLARTEVRPIGRTEALLRLIEQSSFMAPDPATDRKQIEVLSRLVLQGDSYELLAGRDLLRDPALIEKFLFDLNLEYA